jgi:hypothetical protein
MRWILIFVCLYMQPTMAQIPFCEQALVKLHTDSLVLFVKQLTGKVPVSINGVQTTIESRYATHPGNNLAADFLKQTFLQYGFQIEDISFSATGRNIVAFKPGTVNPKKAYLMGAHYDCVGNATMRFEGADDNASGVAALLEAARVVKDDSFPYTLILACWDEEEIGLLGSEAFAPDGPIGYWDVQASINLDMIAYDGNGDSLAMVHTFPIGGSALLAAKMVEVNARYGTALSMYINNPGDKSTDHQSFWNKGATAIGLTEDYDNDLSPNWHQVSDSLANLNLNYFTKMSRLAFATLCEITQTGNYVSVQELDKTKLTIFPNPAADFITLPNSFEWDRTTIAVYNSWGEKVTAINLSESQLSLKGWAPGVYMLIVHTPKGILYAPFVKQ